MAMPRASMARISANASKAIGCFSAAPEPAGDAQARFARPWRHLADHVRGRHAEQAQRMTCGREGVYHAALAGVKELQQAAAVRLPFACQVDDIGEGTLLAEGLVVIHAQEEAVAVAHGDRTVYADRWIAGQ